MGRSGGFSFLWLLTILFIGLKLGGVISWNWYLVLLPAIFSITFSILILIVVFSVACVVEIIRQLGKRG